MILTYVEKYVFKNFTKSKNFEMNLQKIKEKSPIQEQKDVFKQILKERSDEAYFRAL